MKLKLALLAAAGSLAIASGASAQDTGYYTGLGFSYTFAEADNDFEDQQSAVPASFVANYDLDPSIKKNIYATFGKYLDNGFRGEVEYSRRTQEIDEIYATDGFAGFLSDGDMGEYNLSTLMFNLYLDAPLTSRISSYFGVGVGVAHMNVEVDNTDVFSASGRPLPSSGQQPYQVVVGDKDYALAGQFKSGIVFALTDQMDLDLATRYLQTRTFEYGAYINGPFAEVEGGYKATEVTAGLRYNFAAPAAPAPLPAAPTVTYKSCWDGSRVVSTAQCPPRPIEEPEATPEDLNLTVYFDFDKSNLNEASRTLISTRAAEAIEYGVSSVNVEGNTDTSGSASYNNALSQRRAAVVRDALIANGISSGIITTEALGESNLATPTADGVREPLNRRTEVFFDF